MDGQRSLEEYPRTSYTFEAIASIDGGWVIWFPDLPGCMTQAETFAEVGEMAGEAFHLWMTYRFEAGLPIPAPAPATDVQPTWPAMVPAAR